MCGLTVIVVYESNSQTIVAIVDDGGLSTDGCFLRCLHKNEKPFLCLVDPIIRDGNGGREVVMQVWRGWYSDPLCPSREVLPPTWLIFNCRQIYDGNVHLGEQPVGDNESMQNIFPLLKGLYICQL